MSPQIVYLARGRLQRPRANLIQTLHTVEALTAIGAGVRLYTPPVPADFDMGRLLAEMGIRLPIDLRPTPTLHSRWGGWPFFLLHRQVLRGARAIYTRVPDFSLQLARFGHPHFLEVHDTDPLADEGYIARLREAEARGLLRGLTVVAAAGRDALVEAGFRPEHIAVIPNGVDLEAFAAVRPPTREDFAAPRAVYVGRISRDRGLPLFERIAEAGFPVTLVGPRDDEPARPHPNLRLEGAIPHAEVPAALARGAVALMPYQADLRHAASISPIKLFEAMAAGRLVIASDLAPIREVVRDGENGLLVTADDPAAWLAAIERVRADPERALAMAEAGRRTAPQFSWHARARRLLRFCCPDLAQATTATEQALPRRPT
jgi:glycosyltransferase involved in cell wall biosynthesis